MLKYLSTLLLCIISLSGVFAGTRDPQTPDNKYIKYAEDFHCVGKVCGVYKDGSLYCASAVAIDDYTLVTAAHIVENSISCNFTINNKTFPIIKVICHKDFNSTKFGIADIALGKSSDSFELDFYPDLYMHDDEIGKICSIVGYGLNGTFQSGSLTYDGIKRAGSNIIDDIELDMLICSPSYRNSREFTELEFFIASGDSGGGLFINGKLAGINSCVMSTKGAPKSKYGEQSGHTKVSKFIDWIRKNEK